MKQIYVGSVDRYIGQLTGDRLLSPSTMVSRPYDVPNRNNIFSANGVLVAQIDPETGEYEKKMYEIPLELINAYQSNFQRKKNEKNKEEASIKALELRIVEWQEDNSLVVVGKEYRESDEFNTSGDLLLIKVDSKGDLAYMDRIAKRGVDKVPDTYFIRDNMLYYFAIDNYDNLYVKKSEVAYENRKEDNLGLAMFAINMETGKCKKKSIFKYGQKRNNNMLSPADIYYIYPLSENYGISIIAKHRDDPSRQYLMKLILKEKEEDE